MIIPFEPVSTTPIDDEPPFAPTSATPLEEQKKRALGAITDYGQSNDPNGDSLTRARKSAIGTLSPESMAVSPDIEAQLAQQGVKIGSRVNLTLSDGRTVSRIWDDRTASDDVAKKLGLQPLRGRFDFYSPGGAHPLRDARVVGIAAANGRDGAEDPFTPTSATPLDESGTGRLRSAASTAVKAIEAGAGQALKGFGSVSTALLDADRGGNEAAAWRELDGLNQAYGKALRLPPTPANKQLAQDFFDRAEDLRGSLNTQSRLKGYQGGGDSMAADAADRFQPNPAYSGEFLADTVPQVLGSAVQSVAPMLVAPPLGVAAMFGQSYQSTYDENIAKGTDPETSIKRALQNAVVSAGLESVGDGIVAAGMQRLVKSGGKQALKHIAESTISEGLTGAAQEAAGELIDQERLDPAEIAKQGALEALGGFMLGGAAAGAGKIAEKFAPTSPVPTTTQNPENSTPANAGLETITVEGGTLPEVDPLGVPFEPVSATPIEEPAPFVYDDAARQTLATEFSFPRGMLDYLAPADAEALLATKPGTPKGIAALQIAMQQADQGMRAPATPAPIAEAATPIVSESPTLPDSPSPTLSPDEIANRDAEAQAAREMQAELQDVTAEQTIGFGEALARAGGLPSSQSPHFAEHRGELAHLVEGRQGTRKMTGEPRAFTGMFTADGPSMDTIVEGLQEQGFAVETASDVFELAQQWLNGTEPRAVLREDTSQMDVPFSTAAAAQDARPASYTFAQQQADAAAAVAGWENPPQVRVLDSVDAIPEPAVRSMAQARQADGGGAIEAYHQWVSAGKGGKVSRITIIGRAVPSTQRMQELIRHEAVGHGGLQTLFRGPLKEQFHGITEGVWKMLQKATFPEAWAAKHGYTTLAGLADAYGFDASTVEGRARLIEEHLARMAESGQRPTWFQNVIAKIRELLRKISPEFAKWTDADVLNLLEKARQAVQGDAVGSADAVSFSIGPKPGAEISQAAAEEAAQTPEKRRKFIQSVKDSARIRPSVREALESLYTPITNAETVQAAQTRILTVGIDAALAEVLATNEQNPPTALTNTMAIELMGRLQAMGRFDEEGALAMHVAEQSTSQGQAIQALSMLSRLTQSGVQVYAQRTVAKAIKAADLSPEIQQQIGELERIKTELDAAKTNQGTAAVLDIAPELAGLGLSPQELSSVQKAIRDVLVQSAEADMAQAAHEPASPPPGMAEAAAALYQQHKDFTAWTRAMLRQFGDKARSFLQRLWDSLTFKSTLPHARERGSVQLGGKGALEQVQAATPDNRQQRLEEALAQSKTAPGTALSRITGILIGTGMPRAKAEGLAKRAIKAYAKGAKDTRAKLLEKMLRLPAKRTNVPVPEVQKWIDLNKAGGLDNADLYKKIAAKFGLPVFTSQMAAQVRALQNEYARAADPEVKLVIGARMLDTIHSIVPATIGQKAKAVQVLSMLLFRPLVTIRNIAGNAGMAAFNLAADGLNSYVVDPTLSFVFGTNRTIGSAAALERVAALAQPWKDYQTGIVHAQMMGREGTWKDGMRMMIDLAKLTSSGTLELSDIKRGQGSVFTSKTMNLLQDALLVQQGVIDRAFWMSAFHASLTGQMAAAQRNGMDLAAPTHDMVANAQIDAEKATFQDDNVMSATLKAIERTLNGPRRTKQGTFVFDRAFGLGSAVVAFAKVPGSIAMTGLEFSPVGFITKVAPELVRPLIGKPFNARAFNSALTRALAGTVGLTGLGFWLARLGVMTALPDEDKDREAMRRAAGFGQYRLNVSALLRATLSGNWWTDQGAPQQGDRIVSYDWAQPLAIPLAMGAEMGAAQERARLAKLRGQPESSIQASMLFQAAMGGLRSMETLPMLSGITSFASNVGRDGVIQGSAKQALSIPGNFLPGVLTDLNKFWDNSISETRAGGPLDQQLAKIASRIPGLASRFPARYDIFGEAQERYQYATNSTVNIFLNPAFISRFNADPALQEIDRLYRATGDRGVIPGQVPKSIEVNGKDLPLTNEQIAQFQRYVGQTSMAAIRTYLAAPGFAAVSDTAKATLFARAISDASAAGKVALFGQLAKRPSQGLKLQFGRAKSLDLTAPLPPR